MKEISITQIGNIKIGNAQNTEAATGVTVLLCESGAVCGVDVRGGGPASRETQLLNPLAAADKIHAVLLSGGSAFGLDAAGGVMQYLEERDIGFETGIAKVPLVCQSCIFDLGVGDKTVRPTKEMAYEACENAQKGGFRPGNYGAGTGATAGKLLGADYMMKTGIGTYAAELGNGLQVGAIVCVNALGDIYDEAGKQIAGLLDETKTGFRSTKALMYAAYDAPAPPLHANTTIGAVVTNAKLSKAEMNKIAAMAHNGYARAIAPVNTTADGDSLYAMSVGEIQADINIIGTLAADVVQKAIYNAVWETGSAYGLPCAKDICLK